MAFLGNSNLVRVEGQMKRGWTIGLVGTATIIVAGIVGLLFCPGPRQYTVEGQCTANGSPSTRYHVLVYPTVAGNWAKCTVDLDPCLNIANHDQVEWDILPNEPRTVVILKPLPPTTQPPLNSPPGGIPVNPPGHTSSGPVDIANGAVAGYYPYKITHDGAVCVDPKVILK